MANEYLVKGESLTAVADKIRILNGTTESMDLEEMATNVGAANDEVDSQTELLAQAIAALEGKAGGRTDVEICNIEITNGLLEDLTVYYFNSSFMFSEVTIKSRESLKEEIPKNSIFVVSILSDPTNTYVVSYNPDDPTIVDPCLMVDSYGPLFCLYIRNNGIVEFGHYSIKT